MKKVNEFPKAIGLVSNFINFLGEMKNKEKYDSKEKEKAK